MTTAEILFHQDLAPRFGSLESQCLVIAHGGPNVQRQRDVLRGDIIQLFIDLGLAAGTMPYEPRFKYKLTDDVHVTDIDRPGTIELIQVDQTGVTYRVAYWIDGERKSTWLYEKDLSPKKS